MMIEVVVMLMVLFLVFATGIIIWGIAEVKHARDRGGTTRERMLALAAKAATDDSGRALVDLLAALDRAEPGSPVTVAWLHHRPVSGTDGMLVKIAWDGNEWRQVFKPADLASRVEANLPPDARGGLAGKLLADLEPLTRADAHPLPPGEREG